MNTAMSYSRVTVLKSGGWNCTKFPQYLPGNIGTVQLVWPRTILSITWIHSIIQRCITYALENVLSSKPNINKVMQIKKVFLINPSLFKLRAQVKCYFTEVAVITLCKWIELVLVNNPHECYRWFPLSTRHWASLKFKDPLKISEYL